MTRTNQLSPARPRTADAPPKPLYLLGTEPREVHVRGESLRISGPQRAPAALPLSRVERVVCGPGARWDSRALSACLAHGIPITWLDAHGKAVGSAIPERVEFGPMHTSFLTYIQHSQWATRYRNWLRSRRMNVLVQWARNQGPGHSVPQRVFNELKRQYVYQGALADRFVPEAHAWCQNVVVRFLLSEGLDTRYWGFGGMPMHLAEDLAGLFWADLTLYCGTFAEQTKTGPEALLFFETWVQRNQARLSSHFGDLKRHVRTENASWQ